MPTLRRVWQGIVTFRLEYPVSRHAHVNFSIPVAMVDSSSTGVHPVTHDPFHFDQQLRDYTFKYQIPSLTSTSVPLAAYDRVTEFTYFPNKTDDTNRFWSFIPSALKKDTDFEPFAPQTISVGDILSPNGSVYSYTVENVRAPDTGASVSSFAFSNNNLADSCDIAELRWDMKITHASGWGSRESQSEEGNQLVIADFGIKVMVECWIPVNYTLTFDTRDLRDHQSNHVQHIWRAELGFLEYTVGASLGSLPVEYLEPKYSTKEIVLVPCCGCSSKGDWKDEFDPWRKQRLAARSPCGSEPAQLNFSGVSFPRNGQRELILTSFTKTMLMLYHIIRLDLGIVEPNLIVTSRELLHQVVGDEIRVAINPEQEYSYASLEPVDDTLISGWRQQIEDLNNTLHSPSFSYSRSVWRLKPIGPAIISVYTATFTMVSLVWTIFVLTAAFLVSARENSQNICAGCDDLEQRFQRLEIAVRQAAPSTLQADTSDEINTYLDKQYPRSAHASISNEDESVEERSTLMHNVNLGDASRSRAGSPDDSH
ncbi:hypothetical protein CYLTODRAFT_446327 [Cylindrobasidium torrendii FP15055 ss-10]|uniref:Uncharacterized protein n=1 Tax=Cylindrobasidium torrendii FP15055 ss-10 TaxID=1314674 RepID=A0A0D7B134_9AGAR|nr:hypothetical protein CYLTODRAFT_446327 [Cylindrobasidium torrendii FP15055 ss-10]